MIFDIEVNNKVIKARKGDTILQTLNRNGIRIPTLCFMEGFTPTGACRMCVVEVEGKHDLIPACSQPVEEWMQIRTHSPRVVNARRTIIELLLANHPDDCLYCMRNGNCELQNLASEMNVAERRFSGKRIKKKTDPSSISVVRDPEKCILCGRCVRVCEEVIGVSTFDFMRRGEETCIDTALSKPLNLSNCIVCGQCIMVCPTGALHEKSDFGELLQIIHDHSKHAVVQYHPAVAVTFAEAFGMKSGKEAGGILNAALRRTGFDKVFDTAFGGDFYALELANELLNRGDEGLPLFSSCCPAWVKYLEQYHPVLLPHLSVSKSPQQLLGTLIKQGNSSTAGSESGSIFTVAVTPCTARKFEAQREEMTCKGVSDVDMVMTTRELVKFIRLCGIDISNMEPELINLPYGSRSSSALLQAASGGLTEAIIRTLHHMILGTELMQFRITEARTGKSRKEFQVEAGDRTFGFAIVSGMANVKDLLVEIEKGKKNLHFVEVMACPGGCVNGGGQPIPAIPADVKARTKALYDMDEKESIKAAHKNPVLAEVLHTLQTNKDPDEYSQLFHTRYHARDVLI